MPDWKGIVGLSFDAEGFDAYCHTLQWQAWRPSFIVLHNTGSPSLAQRPKGLTKQHVLNLEAFYRDTQGWKAGPHLFVDDRQIWAFLGLDPATMRLHREDPLTTHACPGKNVRKLEVIQEVQDLMVARHAGEHPLKPVP